MRYRKLPVEIEAIQWIIPFEGCLGTAGDILDFCQGKANLVASLNMPNESDIQYIKIETLEGCMKANVGDWIIKGVNGEFYPCKPDIFVKTYESI